MPFGRGLNLHDLKRGLPSLPWACVLGSEYVELLGRERILSTPLYSVAEIPGGLWLQLSERIDDGERDYESYSALRRSAIHQLDHGVFLRGLSDLTRLPKVVERLQTSNR